VRAQALQQQRANAGTVAQSDALSAQRQQIQTAQAAAAAAAELTTDFVAVEKALGLGWQTPAQER